MNEIAKLKSLDRTIEPLPAIDVTPGVMRAVRARSMRREDDRVFPIAASIATLAGVAAVMLAAPSWFATSDPFTGFADALNLVLR